MTQGTQMAFKAGIIEGPGLLASIFLVHHRHLADGESARHVHDRLARKFPHLPIVVMAKDPQGYKIFHASPAIMRLIPKANLDKIEWSDLEGLP